MKNTFYTLFPLLLLFGCGDGSSDVESALEKARQPHEYIAIEDYGPNWQNIEKNTHNLMMHDTRKLRFKIGTGACEKYLRDIQKEDISIHVAVANDFIRTEADGINDIPIKHVKLRCVAMKGVDKNCEEEKDLLMKQLIESGKFTAKLAARILFVDCRLKEDVGVARTFSFE